MRRRAQAAAWGLRQAMMAVDMDRSDEVGVPVEEMDITRWRCLAYVNRIFRWCRMIGNGSERSMAIGFPF